MRSLSQLSSLILQVTFLNNNDDNVPKVLQSCARIVEGSKRIHLQHVRVEFKSFTLSIFGSRLSFPGPSLDACKRLEEALLALPNSESRILVHDSMENRRTGRCQFWSGTIKRAFPRLNKRGSLTFVSSKLSLVYCCYNGLIRSMHRRTRPTHAWP